jgi:hypothetical protein
MPINITGTTGPLFDGSAEKVIKDHADAQAQSIAEEAVLAIQSKLDSVLQHPSGHYRSSIHNEQSSLGSWSVNDSEVVYGPWLEGIGSRNAKSTFKGYHTFELVSSAIESEAERKATDGLDDLVDKLER